MTISEEMDAIKEKAKELEWLYKASKGDKLLNSYWNWWESDERKLVQRMTEEGIQ